MRPDFGRDQAAVADEAKFAREARGRLRAERRWRGATDDLLVLVGSRLSRVARVRVDLREILTPRDFCWMTPREMP